MKPVASFGPKRLPRNILSGVLGQIGGLAVAFFTTPLIVRGLGASDYGLWNVAMAVGSWIGFTNMMCATSAIRFVGQALGAGDLPLAQESMTALRRWSLILGSVGCLILLLAAPRLSEHVFQLQAAQRSWAVKVLMLQGVFVLFQVLTAVESGLITAHQRLDLTQGIRTTGVALQSGGAAAMVMINHGVIAVAWWVAAAQAVEWIATSAFARRLKPKSTSSRPVNMGRWAGEFIKFGTPLITGYFAAQLFLPASRILLGSLQPVAEVAKLAVPLTLAINVKALSTHIAGAIFPALTEKAGQKDQPGLRRLYLQGLRWSWLAVVPPAGLAIALGGLFFSAWISPAFGRDVDAIMPALVIGVNAYYLSAMPEQVAQGMGRPGGWAIIIVIAGLCNVIAASILIPMRGAGGAAEALLIAGTLLTVSLLVWVGRMLDVTLADYLKAFDCRVVVVTAVASLFLAWLAKGQLFSLPRVLGMGVLGLASIALFLPYWLPADEKAWLVRQWQAFRQAG